MANVKGQKKWLYCPACEDWRWAKLIMGANFCCSSCEVEFNFFKSKADGKKRKAITKLVLQKNFEEKKIPKKWKKPKNKCTRERDPKYLAWIRTLPCSVPGCRLGQPSESHHAIHTSQGGSDYTAVPLCGHHHRGEYHGKFGSVARAKEHWGIDLLEIADFLFKTWKNLDK